MIILGIFNTKKYVQVLKKAFIVFNYNLFMDKCMCSLNIEKPLISTLIKVMIILVLKNISLQYLQIMVFGNIPPIKSLEGVEKLFDITILS